MKLYSKDNALSLVVLAVALAGLAVAAASHADNAFAPNPSASAYVSAMPEADALKKQHVQQITVTCEQDRPNSGFHVVYGYWQAGVSKGVTTAQHCDYWAETAAMRPMKSGWQVHTLTDAPLSAYADVVRTVLKASASNQS